MPTLAPKPKTEMQSIDEEPEGIEQQQQDELKILKPLASLISTTYAHSKQWSVLGPMIGGLESRVVQAGNSLFPETLQKLQSSGQPLVVELDRKTASMADSVLASVTHKIQCVQKLREAAKTQLQSVSIIYNEKKKNLKLFANEVLASADASTKPAQDQIQAANKKLGDAVDAVAHSITRLQEVLTPKGSSLNQEFRSRAHQALLVATALSTQSASLLKGTLYDAKKRGPRGSAEVMKNGIFKSAAFIMAAPQDFVNAVKEHEARRKEQSEEQSESFDRSSGKVLVAKLHALIHACNTVFVLPLSAAAQAAVENARRHVEEAEVKQSELELSQLEREVKGDDQLPADAQIVNPIAS